MHSAQGIHLTHWLEVDKAGWGGGGGRGGKWRAGRGIPKMVGSGRNNNKFCKFV